MFKFAIAAAIGLTATISAVAADPIPLPAPLHIPAITAHEPDLGILAHSTYGSPSFGRLVEMCARMGFDCTAPTSADRSGALFDLHGLSEAARADAEKRMALYAEEWAELAGDLVAPVPVHPAPFWRNPFAPFAHGGAPRVTPYTDFGLFQFGHRFPSVPRIQVQPGYAFPNAPLSHGSIRNNPVFPWPSL